MRVLGARGRTTAHRPAAEMTQESQAFPLIHAEALRKVFHPPGAKTIEAVRNASFHVDAGTIYGLLGPNGAGKTTLLRMLATIIRPTSGRCCMAGYWSDTAPEEVRRHVGFLSGNTKLYGRLTGAEVLRYFGRLYGMDEKAVRSRTEELTELLDMGSFIDQRCESLSTGQTQKVSIARVLFHDPPILILDEPTLGLDIMSSRTILSFIRDAKRLGRAILFSTHYMTEAELLCDRIGLIHRGRILAEGTLEELFSLTASDNLTDVFMAIVEREAPDNT
jgi:sodium transport system ATP-binding protein